jgi:hypothetical protein
VPYVVRKIVTIAAVDLDVVVSNVQQSGRSSDAPKTDTLYVTMITDLSSLGPFGVGPLRAAGIDTRRVETRMLDHSEYTQKEPIFGDIRGWWWLATIAEVLEEKLDDFLTVGLKKTVDTTKRVIRVSMVPERDIGSKTWRGEHVWSFEEFPDGGRRYAGRVHVTRGKDKAGTIQVYDYIGA